MFVYPPICRLIVWEEPFEKFVTALCAQVISGAATCPRARAACRPSGGTTDPRASVRMLGSQA